MTHAFESSFSLSVNLVHPWIIKSVKADYDFLVPTFSLPTPEPSAKHIVGS